MATKADEIRAQMAALEEELKKAEEDKKVVPLRPEVVEAESVEEVVEEEAEEKAPEEQIITLLEIGYTTFGRPFFNVKGEANLLAIEGLLVYVRRMLDKEWALRDAKAEEEAKAAAAAAAKAAKKAKK